MGQFPKQHVNIPFEDEKLPDSGTNCTLDGRRQQGRICLQVFIFTHARSWGKHLWGTQPPTHEPSRGKRVLDLTPSPLPIWSFA